MQEIVVKEEKEDIDDIDTCLPDISEILNTVKQEHSNDNEGLPANAEEIVRNIVNEQSSESDSAEADIQKLQELLKAKQKELEESEEKEKRQSRRKSRSSSSPQRSSSGRKKKKKYRKRKSDKDTESRRNAKRKRDNTRETESPTSDNEINTNISQQNDDVPWTKPEKTENSIEMDSIPTEEDLANILRSQSDEEPCCSNQISDAVFTEQVVGVSTSPIQFEFGADPPTGFHDPSFDAVQYTEHFPVQEEEEELQCLPVVNSAGFCGIPMFKRIKLERTLDDQNEEEADAIEETPEDKRNKISSTCMSLLEKLEFPEPSGKFIFTPTIAKTDSSTVSNSILQKISNVHYDFQSIGPKLNLTDWGLKAIGAANGKIAKAIGISADVYYTKIKQKSDTLAGKLIKVETDNHEKRNEQETENEEPTLSTFFKSSVTQTEPLVCQRCVARSRIVGHDIGVQAKVYASSIGTQTQSTAEDHSRVTVGLSENQIKAVYEFSYLLRDLGMNPSIESFQARAMDIYNIIQNESQMHRSPYRSHQRDSSHEHLDQRRSVHSNVIPHPPHIPQSSQRNDRDPRSFHERSNPRTVPPVDAPHIPPVQSFHSPSHRRSSTRDPRFDNQQFRNSSPPQALWNSQPIENFANYQPHGMPRPSHSSPNRTFPGHPGSPSTSYGYPPAAKDSRPSYGRGHRP